MNEENQIATETETVSTTTAVAPFATLVEPQRAMNAQQCVVVIFGASGDLARRKLVPALYNLASGNGAAGNFKILGVGRTQMTDEEFTNQMRDAVQSAKDTDDFAEDKWRGFAGRLNYMVGDPNDDGVHEELAARLDELKRDGAGTNYLFYLSTPPSVAPSIIKGLSAAGLASETEGWRRIIIEKPFGRDIQSARELNAVVASAFKEHQVFRIDHYLGKETVQNILVFRFGNTIFEPIWNRNYVDFVEITAAETVGVEGRAAYYEEAGALRDMVANHLLQLLTLTAMEPPVAYDAESVREEKVQVLRSIRAMTPEQVAERTVRARYAAGTIDNQTVPAYEAEPGVNENSQIETYAAVEFRIENWRWAGVPFYVRTGKRLARRVTEVVVHFKRTPQALFSRTPKDEIEPNAVVLRIQPDEGIGVHVGAKLPGVEMKTSVVKMDFRYESTFGVRSPAAYETLLLDAIEGDATLFTRADETEAEWRLITPIEEAWAHGDAPPLSTYAAGGEGPEEANKLLAREGKGWRKIAK
ncbi:MAG: glucose-6-phosphate dehydrogenase [Pyrinomonadaceae bacterium]